MTPDQYAAKGYAEITAANLANGGPVGSDKEQAIWAWLFREAMQEPQTTLDRDALARMVGKLQDENERLKAEWSRATSPLETFNDVVSHAARMLHQMTDSLHVTAEDDAADALNCCWQEIRAKLV